MAVSKVKIASIIGVMSELDTVIKACGKSEIFHPDYALPFYDNTDDFVQISDSNPYSTLLQKLKDIVAYANKPLAIVDVKDFNVNLEQIKDYIKYLSEKFHTVLNKYNESHKKITEYKKNIEQINHFVDFDVDFDDIFSCKYIAVRFGSLPKDSYNKISSYSDNPYVMFEPCAIDDLYCWGMYLAPIDKIDEIDNIFESLLFKKLDISFRKYLPKEYISHFNKLLKEEQKVFDSIQNKIDAFWKVQYDQCMRFYSKLEELNIYFNIKHYVYKYHNSFILVGWIPAENENEFTNVLKNLYGVDYSIENAEEGLKFSPPVKLKNKRLFKPFEFFVDMYGLPCYKEVDPTIFVAITYTILFGIMFADLGQGIVLSIIGGLMWALKKMKLGKILIRCGVSSAMFGILFGSFFGFEHALDDFYNKLFGLSDKPIEIMEPQITNDIIYTAIGIGIALILISMLINIYSSIKQRNFGEALFSQNGLAGFIFYGSVVFGAVATIIFKLNVINIFYIAFLVVIPLTCILFKEIFSNLIQKKENWKPKSWGDYLSQNAFELFEVLLSYITNTMSFIRVGAFVLVHAGMMLVVFTLANMAGTIGYWTIIVIGNAFVTCLEALLVGIQVLRLNFYEIFSRFFKGQGRAFKPIVANKIMNS